MTIHIKFATFAGFTIEDGYTPLPFVRTVKTSRTVSPERIKKDVANLFELVKKDHQTDTEHVGIVRVDIEASEDELKGIAHWLVDEGLFRTEPVPEVHIPMATKFKPLSAFVRDDL
jgi:hypothetical protein